MEYSFNIRRKPNFPWDVAFKEENLTRYISFFNSPDPICAYDCIFLLKNKQLSGYRLLDEKKLFIEYSYDDVEEKFNVSTQELTTKPEDFIRERFINEDDIINKSIEELKKLSIPFWQDKTLLFLNLKALLTFKPLTPFETKTIAILKSLTFYLVIFGGTYLTYSSFIPKEELKITTIGQKASPLQKNLTPKPPSSEELIELNNGLMLKLVDIINKAPIEGMVKEIYIGSSNKNQNYDRKNEILALISLLNDLKTLNVNYIYLYPAEHSVIYKEKPFPTYAYTDKISIKPLKRDVYLDPSICSQNLLNAGFNVVNTDKLEFEIEPKNYKDFLNFIKSFYNCRGYVEELNIKANKDIYDLIKPSKNKEYELSGIIKVRLITN